ncbi:hypothetical protein SAMN05216456_1296 [Devosia crocina]|uniref:Uncharacterized protein n=1 Tax=Devosia crocina TaxID=429728 RepID=A0A1I7N9I0_9HYPH|nr:hypothetical protein [Devosia crocina]SFV31298.1 hypothetical protein SAMN05216456_1296 [Devosia crocina]
MTAVLDLDQRHFTTVKGNLTLIGTWVSTDDGVAPCLCLIRTGEEFSEHTVPCVVTLQSAFLFDRSSHKHYPDWARKAALMAFGFAEALRIGVTPQSAQRICELIEDNIDDLFGIPPYRVPILTDNEAMAEVTITDRNSGKRVREVLL